MSEKKNIFKEVEERQSLYEREIKKLREKFNMPDDSEPDWQEVCNKGLSWEETKQVIGVLLEIEPGEYGKNYIIEVNPGNMATLYGTTVLDRKMKSVNVGEIVRITYLGEKEGKKGKYKDFKVEVKK